MTCKICHVTKMYNKNQTNQLHTNTHYTPDSCSWWLVNGWVTTKEGHPHDHTYDVSFHLDWNVARYQPRINTAGNEFDRLIA